MGVGLHNISETGFASVGSKSILLSLESYISAGSDKFTVSRVETRSNTSTVTLRVVGDEYEAQCLGGGGYNWATLFLWDINTGTPTLQVEEVSDLRQ
jgi:hypothetical protein